MSENYPDKLFHNRYRLIEKKGRGSFAEVWLARDTELDLDVAIKIYIALDDNGVNDFKEEFRTSWAMNHPNLLHAYYYEIDNNCPFLVMPYCPVKSESLIGTADEKEVWKFIKDVSAGLSYIHEMDVVHNDIKPDNILRNAAGTYMVTDFGISKKMRSTLRKNSIRQMTDSNEIGGGSPSYMAPELFSATPDAVKATDIWALGVTLYEIVTGSLPFFGQGGGMLLHGAELPKIDADVSKELKDLITACLQKDPWDRPTAQQMYDYAKAKLEGHPIPMPWRKSAPTSKPESKTKPKKVENGVLIFAGVILITFLTIFLFSTVFDEAHVGARRNLDEYNRLVGICDSVINDNNADLSSLTDRSMVANLENIRNYEGKYRDINKHYGENYQALNSARERKIEIIEENIREEEQRQEEAKKQEEIKRQEALNKSKGYMDIKEIKFGTEGIGETTSSFYTTLEAASVEYLVSRIYYDGLGDSDRKIGVYVKIIDPNGILRRGAASPNGYSYWDEMTVSPRKGVYYTLKGYGIISRGSYAPGVYRIELWYDGKMIYKQNFTLTETNKATYLTVDSKTSISTSFLASGGTQTFKVSTDAKSWTVWGVPLWCEVTNKTSNSFTLKCEYNSLSARRSDYLLVKADGKDVRIDITQYDSNAEVSIKEISTEHNVWSDGKKGMRIHVNFNAKCLKGHELYVAVYFYYSDGTPLKDKDSQYYTSDGNVATHDVTSVTYDSSTWNDFQIFMPYSQLHLGNGTHKLRYYISITDDTSNKWYLSSEYVYFTYTL